MSPAESSVSSVEQALSTALTGGYIAAEIANQWATLNNESAVDAKLFADVLIRAAEVDLKLSASASVGATSIGAAFLGRDGQAKWMDAQFTAWIGDPQSSVGCNQLCRDVAKQSPAISLVETEQAGVLTVFAATGADLDHWRGLARQVWGQDVKDASVVLVVFAPSRAAELVVEAARTYGLSPSETRLAVSLLETPNLETAAQRVGVTRDTAKDMVRAAARKAGVRTASELVGRIVDLSCGAVNAPTVSPRRLEQAWRLSPTEARVAQSLAAGISAKDTASTLSLSAQTVTTYRRTIFSKAGVNRARDLRRLMAELNELERLANASEIVVNRREVRERLRIIPTAANRQLAFIDYGAVERGQTGSRRSLILLGHGYTTGRLAPPPLLAHLQALGAHVVAVQRPGFGLTTPVRLDDYLDSAADDMATLIRSLGYDHAAFIVRDGGIASAMQTVRRHPGLLTNVVLINPRRPTSAATSQQNPFSALTRLLAGNPFLIEPFAEMLRRQSRTDAVFRTLRSFSSHTEADRHYLEEPGALEHLARDGQGLNARSMAGFILEQRLFALGWEIPNGLESARWSLVNSPDLWRFNPQTWQTIPGLTLTGIPTGGWLIQYTHPKLITDHIAALFDQPQQAGAK